MENIKDKLIKLKALADRGEGGEQKKAEALYKALLKKYNIDESEIAGDAIQTFYFTCASKLSKRLLVQIAGSVRYDIESYYVRSKRNNVRIDCTKAEFILISEMHEHYLKLYESELDIFYHAFLTANELLCSPPIEKRKSKQELSPDELEKHRRAQSMAQDITKKSHQIKLNQRAV